MRASKRCRALRSSLTVTRESVPQAGLLLPAAGLPKVVKEAADGESGVRVAGDLSPDVVLLDVELPDITLAAVLDGNGR
jgi:CheY-like chemotaxis protein